MAALFPLRGASIEPVGTILLDPLLNELGIREVDANRDGVFIARNVEEIQGLIRKAAGIEREDFYAAGMLRDHVEQNHVFEAKTAGKRTGAVFRFDLLE